MVHRKARSREIRYLLTRRCQYTCYYCHKEGIADPKFAEERLGPEDYGFLFEVSRKCGIYTVTLSGGEPLQRNDVSDISRTLKEKECKLIQLNTNGMLVKEQDDLWNYVDETHVSLNTVNPTFFESLSGIKGSYSKVLEGIEYLSKQTNVTLKFNAASIIDIATPRQILEFITFASRCDAIPRYIELYPSTSKGFVSNEELLNRLSELGFSVIDRDVKKIVLSSGDGCVVELMYIFCAFASMQNNPAKYCNENNDVFLTPTGELKPCFNSDQTIDIVNEIRNREKENLITKIEKSFALLGNHCAYGGLLC